MSAKAWIVLSDRKITAMFLALNIPAAVKIIELLPILIQIQRNQDAKFNAAY